MGKKAWKYVKYHKASYILRGGGEDVTIVSKYGRPQIKENGKAVRGEGMTDSKAHLDFPPFFND